MIRQAANRPCEIEQKIPLGNEHKQQDLHYKKSCDMAAVEFKRKPPGVLGVSRLKAHVGRWDRFWLSGSIYT